MTSYIDNHLSVCVCVCGGGGRVGKKLPCKKDRGVYHTFKELKSGIDTC